MPVHGGTSRGIYWLRNEQSCNVLGARLQSRKFPRKDFTKLAVGEPKYEKVNPQSIWKQNGKVRDQGNRKHLLAKGRAGH